MLGKVSLWLAILGAVLPAGLAGIAATSFTFNWARETAFALCSLLLAFLELAALVCGLAGRRTAAGKAGMLVSAILLALFVGGYLLVALG